MFCRIKIKEPQHGVVNKSRTYSSSSLLKSLKYSILPQHVVGRIQKGGCSIGIWGCISGQGAGVHQLYTGRLNQHGYRDILDNTLQASRELFGADELWTFQQDNAPCHTARSIVEYMEEINMQVLPWAASSPDLNPIENL